jgi:hypothetical protein
VAAAGLVLAAPDSARIVLPGKSDDADRPMLPAVATRGQWRVQLSGRLAAGGEWAMRMPDWHFAATGLPMLPIRHHAQ